MAVRTKNELPKLLPAEYRCWMSIKSLMKKQPFVNPSFAEVAEEQGVTEWASTRAIGQLIDKGYVSFNPRKKRSLRLLVE